MDYPKSLPNAGLVDGKFVDEDPAAGTPGSLIPAAWANALMAELLGVIQAAGMAPDEVDHAQLLRAIQTMASSDYKKSVRCATTGPIALSGLQTIDGVALAEGDRVLVKDQASAAQNWIYVASGNAWVRAQDANESAECAPGHLIPVQAGTLNKLTVWQLTNTEAPVIGTTPLAFRVVIGKNGTTLADYGITDAYTKAQTYSQTQVDDLLQPLKRQATEELLGVVRIATLAKIYEGLDDEAAVTSKKLAARLGGVLISGITMTAGGQVLLNHNLGAVPSEIEFTLVCVTAQNGWSPGETVHGALANQSNPSSGATGMGVYWYGESASQVTIGMGNGTWLGPIKGTGGRTSMTLANFTLSARIKA